MCERVLLPGGGFAIVCGGHGRGRRPRRPCVHCGAPVEVLCDHRNSDHTVCSAPLCSSRALRVGTRDYCKRHAAAHQPAPRLPFEAAS